MSPELIAKQVTVGTIAALEQRASAGSGTGVADRHQPEVSFTDQHGVGLGLLSNARIGQGAAEQVYRVTAACFWKKGAYSVPILRPFFGLALRTLKSGTR